MKIVLNIEDQYKSFLRRKVNKLEISKNDWKLYRTRISEWQEAYMRRLVNEYMEVLKGEENASDKFWKLEGRIKKDKKHPGVIVEMSKGNMIFDIIALINADVITFEDLEDFSNELKEQIKFIISR